MIPQFEHSGLLPAGVHVATWAEISKRFGQNAHRTFLMGGLRRAVAALRSAGCHTIYLDGSFVTAKEIPKDFDLCWSLASVDPLLLDPVLLKFDDGRKAMRAKYLGDLFPAEVPEGGSGRTFLEFFQIDRDTGTAKGIVLIDMARFL